MERKNIHQSISFALTAFMPGVFAVMSLVVLIPLIISRGNFSFLSRISWRVFFLEIFLLTAGFLLMSITLKDKINLKRRRVFVAGICAVVLLGWLSIFTQGANLLMIIILSLLSGMFSALSLVFFNKRPL